MTPQKYCNREDELNSKQLSVMDRYLKDINDSQLLTAEEEKDLAGLIELGDENARNQLVEANLRLVVNIARSFNGRGWAIEDLVEEGNLGLIRAAMNYRQSMGTRFSTYASYWIQQAIHRAIINHKLIRLPAYMTEIINKWRRASVLLEEELRRPPYSEEIARRIGLPQKRMPLILKALNAYKVASCPDTSDDGMGLDSTAVDDRELTPEDLLMEQNLLEKIREERYKLSERERRVIDLRFGLEDGRVYTLTEVGVIMGLTRERVRQIAITALNKLRDRLY